MNPVLLSFLPLALLILVAWAVSRGIKIYSNKYSPASSEGTVGVGGWLLFLILGLMFISPILGVGRIYNDFMSAESQNPNLKLVAAWSLYKSATWWTFFVVCGLSFYAGLGLAKDRNIAVVKRAKILIWVIGPGANIIMSFVLPAVIFGRVEWDPNDVGAFIGALVASVLGAAIWTAYLTKSKRVRATYFAVSSERDAQPIIPPDAT